jgi:non-homologous end joining protein Ku
LKDLKENYKHIEREIEETTKKQRDQQHSRYQKVMDLIESLKQSLKTEVNNRKETEEQFMEIVEKRKQEIHN